VGGSEIELAVELVPWQIAPGTLRDLSCHLSGHDRAGDQRRKPRGYVSAFRHCFADMVKIGAGTATERQFDIVQGISTEMSAVAAGLS
jgi:hypothetical protein